MKSRLCPALEAEGFVLAGGRSLRMGQDKALINFAGRPLVELALRSLNQATKAARIVGDRLDLGRFAPVVMDEQLGSGPLSGIAAGLKASGREWSVFLAVDLPLLPSGFLRWMLDRVAQTGALATIPVLAGVPQPLIAVYHRALLPELERSLQGSNFKTIRAIRAAAEILAPTGVGLDLFGVETVAAAGQFSEIKAEGAVSRWFSNVNSPLDLNSCVRWS